MNLLTLFNLIALVTAHGMVMKPFQFELDPYGYFSPRSVNGDALKRHSNR